MDELTPICQKKDLPLGSSTTCRRESLELIYMLECRNRNNHPDRPTLCLVRFLLQTHEVKTLPPVQAANYPAKVVINFHEDIMNVYVHGPCENSNHVTTGNTCSKTQRDNLKFYTGDTACVCERAEETTAYILQCSQFAHPCSLDGLFI